jgi:hypothetical protein
MNGPELSLLTWALAAIPIVLLIATVKARERRRDSDGRFDIDPSGQLPGNQHFTGPAELMPVLAEQKRDAFARCLSEKLLTYGLGRGLGPYDRCAVNSILEQLSGDGYRFSVLVKAIVTSDPFLYREVTGAQ